MGIFGSQIDPSMFLGQAVFWLAIIGVLIIVGFGGFYVNKKRRLIYPCYIFTSIGNKKAGVESTKAGWFKPKWFLKLYDYGGQQSLQTADGRKIITGSSEDFHEINGRRGLFVRRKDDDPKILVPIPNFTTTNYEAIAAIAPSDFTDAAIGLIRQAQTETKGKWDQIIQWALMAGAIVFFLISIIVITQFDQRALSDAHTLILEVAKSGCNSPAVQALIKGGQA